MSDNEDTFNRAFARFEEIQAQYRADRERLIADDEARQREFAEFESERQRLDKETLEQMSNEKIQEGENDPPSGGWSEPVKPKAEFSFGFEDEPTTESFEPVSTSPEQARTQGEKPTLKQRADVASNTDDDFFGAADWLNR